MLRAEMGEGPRSALVSLLSHRGTDQCRSEDGPGIPSLGITLADIGDHPQAIKRRPTRQASCPSSRGRPPRVSWTPMFEGHGWRRTGGGRSVLGVCVRLTRHQCVPAEACAGAFLVSGIDAMHSPGGSFSKRSPPRAAGDVDDDVGEVEGRWLHRYQIATIRFSLAIQACCAPRALTVKVEANRSQPESWALTMAHSDSGLTWRP